MLPASHKETYGFSLTDVLIIVAVIVVIGTLVMPRLLRSGLAAGEASAMDSVRLINTAEITYASRYPDRGFTCALSALADKSNSPDPLLDPALAARTKNGYHFLLSNCNGTPATSYLLVAVPTVPNQTGVRSFCSDQTGIVRYTADSATSCTANSRPVE
jgi:type II secretory pathway pseudopilin PulG